MLFHQLSLRVSSLPVNNSSGNEFLSGHFNIHYKGWLIYSNVINTPGELCCFLSLPLRSLTVILIPALLDQFLASENRLFSVPVSVDSSISSKGYAPFHEIVFNYFCTDWSVCMIIQKWSLTYISNLDASAATAVSGFELELV